jgi:PadR family transcriptional regulator, regulatory protein PadR
LLPAASAEEEAGELQMLCHPRDGSMNDFFDNWTVQVRKGVLELCILNALAEQERYGYDLVKTLVTVPGLGVTEGTLYPLLSRLRVAGLVNARLEESTQGPARKYYSLTKDGRKIMAVMNDYLETLNRGTRQLLSKGGRYA